MISKFSYLAILLSSLCIRAVIKGASIGDAIAILSISAIYGLVLHLKAKEEDPINEKIKKDIDDLKASVGSLKLGRTYSK